MNRSAIHRLEFYWYKEHNPRACYAHAMVKGWLRTYPGWPSALPFRRHTRTRAGHQKIRRMSHSIFYIRLHMLCEAERTIKNRVYVPWAGPGPKYTAPKERIEPHKFNGHLSDITVMHDVYNTVALSNPKEIARYLVGETKLQGYLVGQMLKINNKLNPKSVNEYVQAKISRP